MSYRNFIHTIQVSFKFYSKVIPGLGGLQKLPEISWIHIRISVRRVLVCSMHVGAKVDARINSLAVR